MAQLGRTSRYYKSGTKGAKRSLAKKRAYQKKYNKRPSEVKRRSELIKINREKGTLGNGDKLDASHTKNGVVMKPQSANRGDKDDTKGDKKARGKGRKVRRKKK